MHTDDEHFPSTPNGSRLSDGGNPYSAGDIPPPAPSDAEPSQWARALSGLTPIARLSGDTRMARIIPDSHHKHAIRYYSQFAREFIRGDYNFCAAKMTVARGGKVRAIEHAFKAGEEWYRKSVAWLLERSGREYRVIAATIEVDIPTALAGRLVRLLNEYDNVWCLSMGAVMSELLQPEARNSLLINARKRVEMVHQACIPDSAKFDHTGTLLDE